MKRKINFLALITTLICLLPILLTITLYDKLPNQLPIHFGINGEPDNYASKAIAGFVFPCLLAALNLFTLFALNTDPKKKNANIVIKTVGIWAIPVLSILVIPITLFKGMGYDMPIAAIISALLGLLLIIIGNYLPKSRQSYTVGIRLPWTLENDENWNKTHRFSGFVWVIGGIVVIINAYLTIEYITIAVILLLVVLPVIYSYKLYLSQHENGGELK